MKFKVGDKVQKSVSVMTEGKLTSVILKGKISRIANGVYYIAVKTPDQLGVGIMMSLGDDLTLADNRQPTTDN